MMASLYSAILGHFLVGVLLPYLVGMAFLEPYHQSIERAFFGVVIPAGARAHQLWWMALFGPTVQALSIWMAVLVYLGQRYRNRFAWLGLILGLLIWAPQDMWISLRIAAWNHVWIDSAALLIMLPPLLFLYFDDRTFESKGANSIDYDNGQRFRNHQVENPNND